MGKFAKLIDKIITIWTILIDMIVGTILSAFAIIITFADITYYSTTWHSIGLCIVGIVMVNIINFVTKIFLRSFSKK